MQPHALLLLTALVAGATASTCNDDKYHECQANLNAELNLQDPMPWHNPQTFRVKVEAYYENGTLGGLQTVCIAFRHFKSCMKDQYSQCINPGHFVSSTADPFNAYQFVSTFNTMHFTCGAGFQSYANNLGCMQKAWKGPTNEQLNACRYSFEMKSNMMLDSACQLGNQYMDCWEKEFLSACGTDKRDAQFWGCEYARINIFTRFPACDHRCVLPYNGGIVG